MEIQNIKFHLRIKGAYQLLYSAQIRKSEFKKKTLSSFCVLRVGRFVYNCFFSGYINITGVGGYSAITTALQALYFALDIEENTDIFEPYIIDNISASYNLIPKKKIDLNKKIKLEKICETVISIKYNRELFPNMFIKTHFGTIIWSPNNVVCSVGTKSLLDLNQLSTLISTYNEKT